MESGIIPVEPTDLPAVKDSTCEVCGKVLPDRKRLKQHMTTHFDDGPVRCSICDRTFARRVHLNRHMITHTTYRPFKCDQCGASFATKNFLSRHMVVHQTEVEKEASRKISAATQETHRCPKCGETFSKKWRLVRHKADKHRTLPPLKTRPSSRCVCPVCGKSLSCRLSAHMRVHAGLQPHQCPTCNKSFYQRSKLTSHQLTHTGTKPHTCPVCGKSYSDLRVHLQLKHGNPDTFRHECSLCGRRFVVPAMLRDHLLQHSGARPHQCFTCGRRFPRRSALVKHERSHVSRTATQFCEVCHIELAANSVKGHMLIHTGEKSNVCEWCGEVFRRKDHLRVHRERVHGAELPGREKVERISLGDCLLAVNNENMAAVDALSIAADICVVTQ